jgi:CheY-like chemotaxis protein
VVLLVDDLEDQRELYGEYLEFAGYEVALARDGYEAIDRALRLRPDVVIMDLAMPGLDGFETTQRLKLLEATRTIPVIALTAHGALPREWALSAGCAAYVKKPCYPHDLAVEISSVLAKASGPRPGPVAPIGAPLPARVLVVDGTVGDRELFAEYLEYRGCAVSVNVAPATAAVDVRRLRPDVIVLDLDLAQVAGWDFLRDLRRDPATRDVPVVGLSRQATDAKREEARALGAVLLAKPCEPDALYLAVSKAAAGPAPDRG